MNTEYRIAAKVTAGDTINDFNGLRTVAKAETHPGYVAQVRVLTFTDGSESVYAPSAPLRVVR